MKDYRTEVIVKKLPVSRLVTYLDPKTSNEACKKCTNYNNDWSCPPGQPDPFEYLKPYQDAYLIAVKIHYSEELRERIKTPEGMDGEKKSLSEGSASPAGNSFRAGKTISGKLKYQHMSSL